MLGTAGFRSGEAEGRGSNGPIAWTLFTSVTPSPMERCLPGRSAVLYVMCLSLASPSRAVFASRMSPVLFQNLAFFILCTYFI